MNKLIYITALALTVTIASTGCRHKPVGITPIPDNQRGQIGENQPNTYGQQLGNNGLVSSSPMAENQPFDPSKWDMDRDAFAANSVHFAFDSAVIRDSDTANLQAVAAKLNSDASANVMIEGNCDERGTEEYNRSLGERRAEAAREALVGMGVSASRIHTMSYGKDKPADTGHDESAWSKNRRDDFVLLHPKSGA
ncbi:MAG TPA: peptidoglycan-associated lipoprotein Pal [Verrucomicrobiae bacterium]|jgi:peptidoglycan-associated lipoprotein|nr:peptidoglycan-associated lipoprotein Pal [Verrucomicrobiae bacterium]